MKLSLSSFTQHFHHCLCCGQRYLLQMPLRWEKRMETNKTFLSVTISSAHHYLQSR